MTTRERAAYQRAEETREALVATADVLRAYRVLGGTAPGYRETEFEQAARAWIAALDEMDALEAAYAAREQR